MSETHIIIVGTGPVARIAIDIFAAKEQLVLGLLETESDKDITELNNISIFAPLISEDTQTVMSGDNVEYFVAVGSNAERKAAYEYMAEIAKKPSANAIHPAANISPNAKLGFGNLVHAGSVISANAEIGDQNIVNSHVSVDTDARIGNYCHLSAGVRIGGNGVIEDEVFIGTGAVIHPGITVGKGALIGAGSVVLSEVEPGAVVHGNPAMAV